MPKYDKAVIEKYRQLLKKDPHSQVFAPLADAYREAGDLALAEKIVREGQRRHPQFAAGLVVLCRILKDQERFQEALAVIKNALEFSSENLLAHQLEGDLLLELKRPQEALKSYKMVLFLNPLSAKARKIVQKLESLTAADYEEDVFAMTKLGSVSNLKPLHEAENTEESTIKPGAGEIQAHHQTRSLLRALSLLDAFIVRNDLEKANEVLIQAKSELGFHPDLEKREKILKSRGKTALLSGGEQAEDAIKIIPRMNRENEIAHKKLEKLQLLLRKIEEYKSLV